MQCMQHAVKGETQAERANLPELELGDLVVTAFVLHLPEKLVRVGKFGHLVLALGPPVPVDE